MLGFISRVIDIAKLSCSLGDGSQQANKSLSSFSRSARGHGKPRDAFIVYIYIYIFLYFSGKEDCKLNMKEQIPNPFREKK